LHLNSAHEMMTIFDTFSEPQIEFLEVIETPAIRISGTVSKLNLTIPTIAQVIIDDERVVLAYEFGSGEMMISCEYAIFRLS